MKRCPSPHHAASRRWRTPLAAALFASLLAGGLLASAPAAAQLLNGPMALAEQPRNFPATALFGTLQIVDANEARINGKPVRIAPGLRMLTPHNQLVSHLQTGGRKMDVRYQIEASTGYLIQVWLLRDSELPPRRLLGLLGPARQDPHEVQAGPLGVGVVEYGGSAKQAAAAPAVRPMAQGQNTLQGHSGISGINVTPR